MSVSIYFMAEKCPTCGHIAEFGECGITYNHGPMWRDLVKREIAPDGEGEMAGKTLGFLDNARAGDCIDALASVIENLSSFGVGAEDGYKPTQGNLRSALIGIREMCLRHPDAIITTWR